MKRLCLAAIALAVACTSIARAEDEKPGDSKKERHAATRAARAEARKASPPASAAARVATPRQHAQGRPEQQRAAVAARKDERSSARLQARESRREVRAENVQARRAARADARASAPVAAPVSRVERRDARIDRNRTIERNINRRSYAEALRNYRRERHDRRWYRQHYTTIVLFGGGYYYQNAGYWYPAWGYDPYYSTYVYDEPIYAYDGLPPGQVIVRVQTELQRHGYYRGAVDGLIGPGTRGALANFQRDRGLEITAAIDQPTLATLGLV